MNIKSYKNRAIDITRPVEIYRCLNRKGKMYSIRQDGLVVGHTDNICLRDCKFIVNEAGKRRCITEQQRNVHAYIQGELSTIEWNIHRMWEVKYNPYSEKGFTATKYDYHYITGEETSEEQELSSAFYVTISDGSVWADRLNYLG